MSSHSQIASIIQMQNKKGKALESALNKAYDNENEKIASAQKTGKKKKK